MRLATVNTPAALRLLPALVLLTAAPVGCKPAEDASPAQQSQAQSQPVPAPRQQPARATAEKPATVAMRIGRETFHLEVADTHAEQARGLMYRKSMPADHGMIFVNEEAAERSFWMKNTYIPLDILYLDAGGKVISIKQMTPHDLTGVTSDGPAMYAIELNQGAAIRARVTIGDRLSIPPELRPR